MASASAMSAMRLSAAMCRYHPRPQTLPLRIQLLSRPSPVSRRAFSTTITRRKEEPPKGEDEPTTSQAATDSEPAANEPKPAVSETGQPPADTIAPAATPDEPAATSPFAEKPLDDLGTTLMAEEAMDQLLKRKQFDSVDSWVTKVKNQKYPPAYERQFNKEVDEIVEPRQDPKSFFFDETDPDQDSTDFDEFNEDDMTEMAHAKLHEVQEMRHYMRLATWELPLLSKLAKPFEAPKDNMPLRWRYTTYFGDTHPAEKKVVVQFAPDDLGLTLVQANKLKKLCGTRYHPELELVKMSSEGYDTPAQNKRYLAELVDKLIVEAKDPKDTFEDVPLDTRHHKTTQRPRFPKEWLMTKERQQQLSQERSQMKITEMKRRDTHQMVDGNVAIENHLVRVAQQEALKLQTEGLAAQATVKVPARSNARARAKR